MSDRSRELRAMVGILGGAILGGAAYGASRALLPGQLALGAALVGLGAGLGARLVGAIGSPRQLRVVVFGSLFALMIGEYAVFALDAASPTYTAFMVHLLSDLFWLVFTVAFLVGGIFIGVYLLVGGDPLEQVVTHAGGALTTGASGTQCPRCDSLQTVRDPHSHALECAQCGHTFRPR